jgi:hygromycin-B 7''-O-kinase
MKLPDHTPITPEIVATIAARHGLAGTRFAPLPNTGIINAIYVLDDDYVFRIPRNHPGHTAQTRAEAIAAPAAHAAGVRTPRMIAFDDICDLLPVPYTIFERVRAETLALLDLDPEATPHTWRDLGRDLALLHTRVPNDGPVRDLRTEQALPDPRESLETRAQDGHITALEVRWLTRWLDRLATSATVPVPACVLHHDVQTTNIMVHPTTLEYVALIDWGNAGWGDPAHDFFGMPLRAVPHILAGHREIAPLPEDHTAEARILWRHLQMALAILPRGPTPGLSWGERPLAWLLEVFRFFADDPGGNWRNLRP